MSENSNYTMNELMENYNVSKIRTGDIVTGTVISVNEDFISVNLNYKSDGILSREEYSNADITDLSQVIKEGEKIEAYVLRLSDQDGNVVLSRKIIEEKENWKKLISLKEENPILETKIIEANEYGAFALIEHIKGFIPKNQLSINKNVKPADYVGKAVKVKILNLKNNKGKKQLILSSKAVEKIENQIKEKQIWEALKEGEIYEGTVKNILDFGAFVNIKGIDGLLHVNEIAWTKIKHPSEVLKEGDKIKVMIKKIDIKNKKLSLSYKATVQSPWSIFVEKYNKGDEVNGVVTKIEDYGAFVNIDDVQCLLHVKDISWFRTEHPSDVLKVGQEIKVKILDINKKNKKVNLGIKQLTVHPFDKFSKEHANNDIIKVIVRRIVSDGVYVDINEDLDSFIHISKISKDKLRTPAQVLKIDEEKEAKIIGIDRKTKKIKLSFILNNQQDDKFSRSKEPISYTLGNDNFTIGDLLKKK